MPGRHRRVQIFQMNWQLSKQYRFDRRTTVEMDDGRSVADAIEHASSAVDDDVIVAGDRVTVDLLILEGVRPDQDGPFRARGGELADRLQIVCENLFQIDKETIDIGWVPACSHHGIAFGAGLTAEARVDQRKIGIDQQVAARLAVEQRAPAGRGEIEARTAGEV